MKWKEDRDTKRRWSEASFVREVTTEILSLLFQLSTKDSRFKFSQSFNPLFSISYVSSPIKGQKQTKNHILKGRKKRNKHDHRSHLGEREGGVDGGMGRVNFGAAVLPSFLCNFHGVPDLHGTHSSIKRELWAFLSSPAVPGTRFLVCINRMEYIYATASRSSLSLSPSILSNQHPCPMFGLHFINIYRQPTSNRIPPDSSSNPIFLIKIYS